jgi:hypothetical protein
LNAGRGLIAYLVLHHCRRIEAATNENGSRLVRVASRERSCKQVLLTTSFQLREALERSQELQQRQVQRLHSCCKQELHSLERNRKHRKEQRSSEQHRSRCRKEQHS